MTCKEWSKLSPKQKQEYFEAKKKAASACNR